MKKTLKKIRKDAIDQKLVQAYTSTTSGTNENCHQC